MNIAPSAQTSIFFAMACTSWGLVEVPRYLFYALNLVDAVPYPLFWLRYSLFAILYPTGITGELGCMYYAGLYLQTQKVFTLILLIFRSHNIFIYFIAIHSWTTFSWYAQYSYIVHRES